MSLNAHGLSRQIPTAIKREVRKRCGFGCVICGVTIYEYEHFYPDFKDASAHSCEQIVLLCPNHHSEVSKGLLPKEYIAEAAKQPTATKIGFSRQNIPWFKSLGFKFMLGGLIVTGTPIPIIIRGETPISFFPHELGEEPLSINANFKDQSGSEFLSVFENEWRVNARCSDFEWVGSQYRFKDKAGETVLSLRFETSDNLIIIERLICYCHGIKVEANESELYVGNMKMPKVVADSCGAGIVIR